MALNPYDNCPCGSGKKYKWCCTAYFDRIEKAITMLEQKQFDNAVKLMEGLAKEFPDRPQIWGYLAHILFREGHIERADEALNKAFEIEPNFPMGHFLRGIFRQAEGEVIGALLLFRKASETYPPEATEQLAQVYEMIARDELILNRPIASRAALALAVKFSDPRDTEIRQEFEVMFGQHSRLPGIITKEYKFRPTAKPITLSEGGRLSTARAVYETLVTQTPTDPAAWFNLGLVRAWQGDQAKAVEAMNYSLESEWFDPYAEETGALLEVLRCGAGNEEENDYIESRVFFQMRDGQAVSQLLQAWEQEGRMFAANADQENGVFTCMLVEPLPSIVDTGTTLAKVVANINISNGLIRLWHMSEESVTKVAEEIRERLNMAVSEPHLAKGMAQFGDIVQEALAYPVQTSSYEEAEKKLNAHVESYFENTWVHRTLRSLSGVAPIDAAGSTMTRKRLLGVVRFYEANLQASAPRRRVGNNIEAMKLYDFDRLRHKVNATVRAENAGPPPELVASAQAALAAEQADASKAEELANQAKAAAEAAASKAAATKAAEPPKPAAKAVRDFNAMNAADLAAVNRDELTYGETEDAMRAAFKLDAKEIAVAFARAGIAKPHDAAKPDRFPLYLCAIQGTISEAQWDAGVQLTKEGQEFDATNNEGKRVNDYAIQRARIYCRKGDIDAATTEFEEIIARTPNEPKYYITATESMLSAKQSAKALHFAEMGLAKARSIGNRDLEGACLELSEAAKRLK